MSAAAALISLVQYPHAINGLYFFYAAPLVLLLASYTVAMQPLPPRVALGGTLLFFLAFAAFHLNGPDPHRNVNWGVRRTVEPMGLSAATSPFLQRRRPSIAISWEQSKPIRRLVRISRGPLIVRKSTSCRSGAIHRR